MFSPVDQDHNNIENVSSVHSFLKYLSLFMFTLQKVLVATLIHYTHTPQRQHYIGSTLVFFGEIQKAIFSILLIFCQECSIFLGFKKLVNAIVYQSNITLKLSFIAVIYTIQNNLSIVAMSKLNVPTYVVTDQLKILTTAIFARILLKREIKLIQWIGLILLFAGISLVQRENMLKKKTEKTDLIHGLVAAVICCICSGFAGIYFEKIVKNTDLNLWICNVQLAGFSIITNSVVMFTIDRHKIEKFGIFHDYSSLVWLIIVGNSIGGLIVALVMKYSDNILKGFASSISVALAFVVGITFFHFQLSFLFVIGSLLVMIATIIYSNAEWLLSSVIFKTMHKNKPVSV